MFVLIYLLPTMYYEINSLNPTNFNINHIKVLKYSTHQNLYTLNPSGSLTNGPISDSLGSEWLQVVTLLI